MTSDMLVRVLDSMSSHVQKYFPSRVKLVVHGGACFLLDRELSSIIAYDNTMWPTPKRSNTRDVDYINRSFASEWRNRGMYDATEKLKKCIWATAAKFGLGTDWMNSDADVALPVAYDAMGREFDPISSSSKDVENPDVIYTSPNGWLVLISVTRWWAISMKLMRFQKQDPQDIYVLFKSLSERPDCQMWDATFVETKLSHRCWPMISRLDAGTLGRVDIQVRHIIAALVASRSIPSTSSSAHLSRPRPQAPTYPSSSTSHLSSPAGFHFNSRSRTPVASPAPGSRSSKSPAPAFAHHQPRSGACKDPACTACPTAKPGLTWATWTDDPNFLEKIRQGRADTIRLKRSNVPTSTSMSGRTQPPTPLPVTFAGYS